MNHPMEGEWVMLLDGELGGARAGEVEAHLEECAQCTRTLEELRWDRDRIREAVALLEAPHPLPDARAAIRRRAGVLPERSGLRSRVPLARAALFLLAMAGAASAAVPGSPVRTWIRAALPGGGGADLAEEGVPPAAVATARADGVSLPLPADAMEIAIRGALPPGGVRIILVDGNGVGVFADGEARFETAIDRIQVTLIRGDVEARLPRVAQDLHLHVEGRTLLRMRRGQVETDPSLVRDAEGVYRWPEGPGR